MPRLDLHPCRRHPRFAQEKEEVTLFGRKKENHSQSAEVAKHPTRILLMAARYVGAIAPPGATVQELGRTGPCYRATNPPGRQYRIVTDSGEGTVFFFPDHAAIWMSGEPQPRAQIPTEMIINRVLGYEEALAFALKDIRDD
jgi:hypothetical protein